MKPRLIPSTSVRMTLRWRASVADMSDLSGGLEPVGSSGLSIRWSAARGYQKVGYVWACRGIGCPNDVPDGADERAGRIRLITPNVPMLPRHSHAR